MGQIKNIKLHIVTDIKKFLCCTMFGQKAILVIGRARVCRLVVGNVAQQQPRRWLTLSTICSKTFKEDVEQQRKILEQGGSLAASPFQPMANVENRDWTQMGHSELLQFISDPSSSALWSRSADAS